MTVPRLTKKEAGEAEEEIGFTAVLRQFQTRLSPRLAAYSKENKTKEVSFIFDYFSDKTGEKNLHRPFDSNPINKIAREAFCQRVLADLKNSAIDMGSWEYSEDSIKTMYGALYNPRHDQQSKHSNRCVHHMGKTTYGETLRAHSEMTTEDKPLAAIKLKIIY